MPFIQFIAILITDILLLIHSLILTLLITFTCVRSRCRICSGDAAVPLENLSCFTKCVVLHPCKIFGCERTSFIDTYISSSLSFCLLVCLELVA